MVRSGALQSRLARIMLTSTRNPAVSDDCLTGFWIDEAYCVGVSKQIQYHTAVILGLCAVSIGLFSLKSSTIYLAFLVSLREEPFFYTEITRWMLCRKHDQSLSELKLSHSKLITQLTGFFYKLQRTCIREELILVGALYLLFLQLSQFFSP